jgi:hypothetical protein
VVLVIPHGLGLLICCTLISTIASATSLKFSMLEKGETQNIAMCVLQEAYANINIETSFHGYPSTRSLKLSNEGKYDGETARIYSTKNNYSNLIPILTPILLMRGTAFTIKHKDFKPNGFSSLSPFNIIINKAVLFVENGTKDLPNVDKANSFTAPFKMLQAGRGDIVVTAYLTGLAILRQLKATLIVPLDPPVARVPLYHFLHKKNIALLPKISTELIKMNATGRVTEIYDQYTRTLSDPNTEPNFDNGDPPSIPCPTFDG